MSKAQLLVSAFLLLLFVGACAPTSTPTPAPAAMAAPAAQTLAAPVAKAPAKQAWEEEWNKVLEGAKEEGRVLVHSSNTEFRQTLSEAMASYGVQVEMIIGKGGMQW